MPERVSDSHVWLFPGVNREHRWIQLVREAYEDGEGEDDTAESGATEGGLKVPSNEGGSRSRSRSPDSAGAEAEKRPRFA